MPEANLEQRVAALETTVEHLVNDVALLQEQNQQVLEQLTHIAEGIEGLEGWQRHIEEELARKANEEGVEASIRHIEEGIEELRTGLRSDIERLETRIRSLEERGLPPPEMLEGMIAEAVRSVLGHEIEEALSEFKRTQIDPAFRELNGRLSGLEERIRALEEAIDELRGMALPEERIGEIVRNIVAELDIPVLDDEFFASLPERTVNAIIRKGFETLDRQQGYLSRLLDWAVVRGLQRYWTHYGHIVRRIMEGRRTGRA